MMFAFLPFFTIVIIKDGIMDNDHLCTVQKNIAKMRRSVFYHVSVICMFSGFVSGRIKTCISQHLVWCLEVSDTTILGIDRSSRYTSDPSDRLDMRTDFLKLFFYMVFHFLDFGIQRPIDIQISKKFKSKTWIFTPYSIFRKSLSFVNRA